MLVKIFDTFSKKNVELTPSDKNTFKIYCCGPTVYGPAHVGNFRTFIYQDVLRRVLELTGTKTKHVRNITNVDDKTINGAKKQKIDLSEYTNKWTKLFQNDSKKLNLLTPHVEPGAVEHIPHQIKMIEILIKKKHAYIANDNSIYYDVSSFKEYGKLSNLDNRELLTDHSNKKNKQLNSSDEYTKDDLSDFALWKSTTEEDNKLGFSWDSPWGKGRPGWHLECSAMTLEHLGESIDLHSGGVDLVFPHHENEIAQSEATTGTKFSHNWFHIAHLKIENQKMSKSLGNLYTLEDLEKKGYSPMVYKYLILTGHYRQPFNFTFNGLQSSLQALNKLAKFIVSNSSDNCKSINELNDFNKISQQSLSKGEFRNKYLNGYFKESWIALADNLNTPKAIGNMFSIINTLNQKNKNSHIDDGITSNQKIISELLILLSALGLDLTTQINEQKFKQNSKNITSESQAPNEIISLAEQRNQAKVNKDWATADNIRKTISEKGWTITDTSDGFELNKN